MTTPSAERPFSTIWTFVSVVLFLAIELAIGTWVGPLVLGKYVSPMFHLELQMLMHIGSLYLGGMVVGVISPGVRLMEPAVAAFISVALTFMISFFMPGWFWPFTPVRMVIGGVIGMAAALAGAYFGEKLMGNIEPDEPTAQESARGRLRSALWHPEDGMFSNRDRDASSTKLD